MISTRRLHVAALGLAFSGILALTACGGDDSSSDTTTAATEATTDAGSDSTADTTADDTTDTTFDTSDVDPLSAAECQELYDKFSSLGFDLNSSEAPEDIDAAFEAIRDAVPDDLKGDVETLQEAYAKLQDLTSADGAPDITDPKYQEAIEALSAPEVQEASARITAYFENCESVDTGG